MAPTRALILTSVLLLAGLAQAAAQFTSAPAQSNPFPPPPGQSNPFPPAPGQSSPFPPPPGQASRQASPVPAPGAARPGGSHPCEAFVPLRQAAERDASAIRAASERKASREQVCPLFQRFAVSESKVIKFMETNRTLCGVPPSAIKQVKTNHAQTVKIRNVVCSKAPAAPAGPTLSDALGGPLTPTEPPKPGRGTFDTLTGNVLAR
jgi:hypothetical protein